MFEKGLVRRDESTRPHVFRAAVAEAQVKRRFVTDLLDQVFEGSATSLAMQALSVKRATPEELRQLRELLDEIEGAGIMTIVEGVGWVLLHFVWQGAVIALALAAAARVDPRRAGEAALRPVVRRVDADARRGAGHGRHRDGGPLQPLQLPAVPKATPVAPATCRRGGRDGARAQVRRRGPQAGDPAADERRRRWPHIRRSRRRSSGRCRGSSPLARWCPAPLRPSARRLVEHPRVLRVVGVSPVPEWCRAQLDRARVAHADRPPRGDRVFDAGLGAGDRGPREAGDRAARGGAVGTERRRSSRPSSRTSSPMSGVTTIW